jgi:hypothetical protein
MLFFSFVVLEQHCSFLYSSFSTPQHFYLSLVSLSALEDQRKAKIWPDEDIKGFTYAYEKKLECLNLTCYSPLEQDTIRVDTYMRFAYLS